MDIIPDSHGEYRQESNSAKLEKAAISRLLIHERMRLIRILFVCYTRFNSTLKVFIPSTL